jgi:hypothetical protein
MELETYEANLADIALQEQTFYETKPTALELQMASQLMSQSNQNGGHFVQITPGGFPLLTPIINSTCKGKKKKSVKFLTYVQVRIFFTFSPAFRSNVPKTARKNLAKTKTNLNYFFNRSLLLE